MVYLFISCISDFDYFSQSVFIVEVVITYRFQMILFLHTNSSFLLVKYLLISIYIMVNHNHSKRKRGGSNLVDLALPAAFVYANNNFSKGTMFSAPKKFLKKSFKGVKRTLRRASRGLTPRRKSRSSRKRRGTQRRGRR